jgi:nitrogenase molybdenum-iron protein alpha/beta subunit
MRIYSEPQADSLTGALLALDSLQDVIVILNGPTGCKSYHSAISDSQYPRELFDSPLEYLDDAYYGQPRIPSTYLGGEDYVFGAADKLSDVLTAVAKKQPGLIAVVNSPGAALIGDDLERLMSETVVRIPCLAMENPGYSKPATTGFREAVKILIKCLVPAVWDPDPAPSVNLVGISVMHKHWLGSLSELRRSLDLMGVRVNAVLVAGEKTARLKRANRAQANLVVFEDCGGDLARWMESESGIPAIIPDGGAPIGFEATENWLTKTAEMLEVDPAPAVQDLIEARKRVYKHLTRFTAFRHFPKGAAFTIEASPSIALGLTRWLYEYFAMIPAAVQTIEKDEAGVTDQLRNYLSQIGCQEAWGQDPRRTPTEVSLAGSTGLMVRQINGETNFGIDIGYSDRGYLDLIPKSLLGVQGALFLTEQLIKGLERIS